ncbi:hypothetical protein RKD05_000042 [Microbacterium sp. SLBN-111]
MDASHRTAGVRPPGWADGRLPPRRRGSLALVADQRLPSAARAPPLGDADKRLRQRRSRGLVGGRDPGYSSGVNRTPLDGAGRENGARRTPASARAWRAASSDTDDEYPLRAS